MDKGDQAAMRVNCSACMHAGVSSVALRASVGV